MELEITLYLDDRDFYPFEKYGQHLQARNQASYIYYIIYIILLGWDNCLSCGLKGHHMI